MLKKFVAVLICTALAFCLVSCFEEDKEDTDSKLIAEAQPVVDEYMNAFCVLDIKGMAEATDADIDYTQLEYLSLDELRARILAPFATLEAMGIPFEAFNEIADVLFDSYEKYSSYKIIDSKTDGDDVVFEVSVEYISLETMSNLVNTAVNRIDMEALESQLTGSIIMGGLQSMLGGSMSDVVKTALTPIIENIKLEINRSVEQLTPEKGSITLVATKVDGEWVISDSKSEVSFISGVFNTTK